MTSPFLLLQLADSAFPTGGFAHSGGLEAAYQLGEIDGAEGLFRVLSQSLEQAGHGALPLVSAAHEAPARLAELDALCDATLTNHVANRASRVQGQAWLATAAAAFSEALSSELSPGALSPGALSPGALSPGALSPGALSPGALSLGALRARVRAEGLAGHLAPVFGAVCALLGQSRDDTQRLFLFHHLRGLISSAVRLSIVGPLGAQALQHRLGEQATRVWLRCRSLGPNDVCQTAPLLDLFQAHQDRLYSRLFSS